MNANKKIWETLRECASRIELWQKVLTIQKAKTVSGNWGLGGGFCGKFTACLWNYRTVLHDRSLGEFAGLEQAF